jgi:hypothetical protein
MHTMATCHAGLVGTSLEGRPNEHPHIPTYQDVPRSTVRNSSVCYWLRGFGPDTSSQILFAQQPSCPRGADTKPALAVR